MRSVEEGGSVRKRDRELMIQSSTFSTLWRKRSMRHTKMVSKPCPLIHPQAPLLACWGVFLLGHGRVNHARRLVDHPFLQLNAGDVGILGGDLLLLPARGLGRVVHPRQVIQQLSRPW